MHKKSWKREVMHKRTVRGDLKYIGRKEEGLTRMTNIEKETDLGMIKDVTEMRGKMEEEV